MILVPILLFGCTKEIVKTKIEYVYPPEEYLIPTEVIRAPDGASWGEILEYSDILQPAKIGECNLDKSLIQKWIDEHKKKGQ